MLVHIYNYRNDKISVFGVCFLSASKLEKKITDYFFGIFMNKNISGFNNSLNPQAETVELNNIAGRLYSPKFAMPVKLAYKNMDGMKVKNCFFAVQKRGQQMKNEIWKMTR
jgi:hypothetical protein